ncbi:MAG: VCBS repeat-containing protein [Flavobacteriales bacterium]|nr:VCBS repeat-containing protein [Flavobacteriales bacterium]
MRYAPQHITSVLLLCAVAFPCQAQFGAGIEIAADVPNDLHGRIGAVDLDGDGDLDLVFKTNAGLVWVENMDGAGNFGAPNLLAGAVAHFAVADVDGDSDQDVVYADGDGQLFWIANLDGLGTFGPPQLVTAVGGPVGRLLCADLDGDGLPEVALALNSGGQAVVQVFLNTGGAFAPAMVTPFGTEGSGLRLLHGDIDLDGNADLVTLDGDGILRVMRNDIGDAVDWGLVQVAETMPDALLQLVDIDDDGDLDILMSQSGLMQWGKNLSAPGVVVPFVLHDIAPDGAVNHFGHALRLGCGLGVSIIHYQGIAGHLFWSFFDLDVGDFIRPSPDILIAGISAFGMLASADLNGDGREDIIHLNLWNAMLMWYPNEMPEVADPGSVSIAPFDPVCETTGPFILTNGSPGGGVWSGPGASGLEFHPANAGVGTFTLTYQAAAPCPVSAQADIVVIPTTSEGVELVPFPILCVSGGAYPLDMHASPSTGIWSGPGVTNNVFIPPGVGAFTLTYSIEGSCIQVQSDMEVIGAPVAVLVEGDINNGCGTDPLVFEAYPPGGTWSGLAGPDGVVPRSCDNRPAAGQVLYTYAAPNGDCVGSTGEILDLKACVAIDLGPDIVLCSNADTLVVTLLPPFNGGAGLGGDFDLVVYNPNPPGPQLPTGYFSPDKLPGVYTLTGIRTASNQCPGYDTLLVAVVAAPDVLTGQYGPLCSDGGPIELLGEPAGGVWSGDGVIGGQFDPTEAGTGTWTLTYTVTENECTGSASTDIQVNGSIPVDPGT